MTDTVYAVNGGMEDWAYGAGWDTGNQATVNKCRPNSYPISDSFFNADSNIRSAIFLVETDSKKDPPEAFLGFRSIY